MKSASESDIIIFERSVSETQQKPLSSASTEGLYLTKVFSGVIIMTLRDWVHVRTPKDTPSGGNFEGVSLFFVSDSIISVCRAISEKRS